MCFEYKDCINGKELLTIPEALNTVTSRTISLLPTDIKTRKLIGVIRVVMEEALKIIKKAPKILAKRSNAMWDVLLATEEEAKGLAGNVLTTKALHLKTKYMGTRRTKITAHSVKSGMFPVF